MGNQVTAAMIGTSLEVVTWLWSPQEEGRGGLLWNVDLCL